MAIALNRVTLIGNLGADPEIRTTTSGSKVSRIRVATSENYKDKNGEWQEQTEWHSVLLWNWLAERAEQSLKKGNKVYIEGKLKSRSYEDKDKITRYVTEVFATQMILLTPKEGGVSSKAPLENVEYTGSENIGTVNESSEAEHDEVPF